MPIVALFMVTNVIVGCYLAIRLGYGPPNWQTALNLIVPVTTFQDRLNEGRDWLNKKAPWADELLNRLNVPNPFMIVDPSVAEETGDGEHGGKIDELAAIPIEELLADQQFDMQRPETEPAFYDEAIIAALMNSSVETWFVNNKNAETSLLKLNVVSMKSGRFVVELDGRIRVLLGKVSKDNLKQFIADIKDDCQHHLATLSEITAHVSERIEEFGEFKTLAEEIAGVSAEHITQVESMLKGIDAIAGSPPEEGAKRILQILSDLRVARHRLRDMRERVFTLVAAKEQRLDSIPKQLFVDELSGMRGRIGLMATLGDWWKNERHKGRFLTFVLVDFVKFGEVNDNHGMLIGDKIIKHFGSILKERFDAGDLFGIYYGNAFLTVTINAGLQKTVATIERIRQRQMKTVYKAKKSDQPIQVLLTGAVVESTGEQSIDEVLAALDKTMAVAKSEGRNHTFCWNAGAAQPEKTESPEFVEQEQKIVLE